MCIVRKDKNETIESRQQKMGKAPKSGLSLNAASIQLPSGPDEEYRLSVSYDKETGKPEKYTLHLSDKKSGLFTFSDFENEAEVRRLLYQAGDEDRCLDEIFARYLENHTFYELETLIWPLVTVHFRMD